MSNLQYNETKAVACRQMVEQVYLGIASFFRGDPKYSTSDGYIIRPEEERWLIAHLNDRDIPPPELSLIIECFAQTSAVRAVDALIEFVNDITNSRNLRRKAAEAISLIDSEDHRAKLIELRSSSTGELRRLYEVALNPVKDEQDSFRVQFKSLLRRFWQGIRRWFLSANQAD